MNEEQPDGYLLDPTTIEQRRWKRCCGVTHALGTRRNEVGVLKTVIVACDRKTGHNGSHRGTFDGRRYFFRDLTEAQKRARDEQALKAAKRAVDVANAAAEREENAP